MFIDVALQLGGDIAGLTPVEIDPAPDFKVHQGQQRIRAIGAVGFMIVHQSRYHVMAEQAAPRDDSFDSSCRNTGASSRFSHAPIGVPKPRFLRSRMSAGSRSLRSPSSGA
jgi:hypothetical protein